MRRYRNILVTTLLAASLCACGVSTETGSANSEDSISSAAGGEQVETDMVEGSQENAGAVDYEPVSGGIDATDAIIGEEVDVDKTETEITYDIKAESPADLSDYPSIQPGEVLNEKAVYTDKYGDTAVIPAQFKVSEERDEQSIRQGLVIIGPDGSEFVWVPTTVTELEQRDFGSYFFGGGISSYYDETDLESYQAMEESCEKYGGFYMGRYEASYGGGNSRDDYLPVSKEVNKDNHLQIWVQFSPQDTVYACENIYSDNATVQGFFPWGVNYDTTLQWLVDSGCLTSADVQSDSTSWGNYSNDTFSDKATGKYTGIYEEANTNNIYDLAGNNWEWTQERNGSNYVMRGGGYNLMGGSCKGSDYPAAVRDPLPGNNHHPNVCFRVGLYVV